MNGYLWLIYGGIVVAGLVTGASIRNNPRFALLGLAIILVAIGVIDASS